MNAPQQSAITSQMMEAGGFEDLLAIPPSLLIAIVDEPETILENSCHAVPSTGAIEGVHLQMKWYCGYLRTHVSYSAHRANQSSAYFSHATACPEEWWQPDPPRNDTFQTGRLDVWKTWQKHSASMRSLHESSAKQCRNNLLHHTAFTILPTCLALPSHPRI